MTVLGTSLDGKAIENSFEMPLLEVTGHILLGRVSVFAIGLQKTEGNTSVAWMVRNFKYYITEGGFPFMSRVVTCDVTYAIITPVKDLLATSYVMLD